MIKDWIRVNQMIENMEASLIVTLDYNQVMELLKGNGRKED
jgi:hypothetical protein